ncbi:MAG TPA: aminoglycoside phosphotransferase family protein, partial [Candidatus Limnocylindrales bacterium]
AELRSGSQPPELRPRWARPGWRRRASGWMQAAAVGAGRPLTGEPRPFYLRGISALLIAPTAGGDVFLKAVFPIFHAEPVITKLLADRLPRDVPRVLAIEADEGWLLVEDIGSGWIGSLPEADRPRALAAGARTLIEIQRMLADRPDDLAGLLAAGAQDRGLAGIPAAFAAALAAVGPDRAVTPLSDMVRAEAVGRVEAAVARLAELPFPVSLVHGDFHSDNAAIVDDRIVIIDWSDAAIGSPLVDLVTWVAWSDDRQAEIDEATDAWVDAWSPIVPASTIRDHLDDILVAGAAYQVISYDAIVRALEPATRYTMTGGGDHFLPMILDRLGSAPGRS